MLTLLMTRTFRKKIHTGAAGYMHKSVWRNEGKNLAKIQLDCRFSNRSELRWRDDLESDWGNSL